MKLRTSFFNKTALRKDILRYSPIWALYTIFLLLVLFGSTDTGESYYFARDIWYSLEGMAVVNLLYAGICAAFLFMDLFNGRLCNALHAFPYRRESWLVTHVVSGLLFSIVPNLLVSVFATFMLGEYLYLALFWLAISTLQYVFFFGTAVLCGMCAGNLIGMAANYGIFHFITLLIYAVAELMYQPLLHGVQFYNKDFYHFFPLSELSNFEYIIVKTQHTDAGSYMLFQGLEGQAWLYLGLCAGAGIISLVLAGLVYRKRQLETAGDLISLKRLSPLFILICTIGAGAFLYLFSEVFGNEKSYVFLLLGMVIGYFAGQMLLNRTLKVFTKKAFLRLGIIVAVLAGSLWVTWLDPLGVTRYVPKVENIQYAAVIGADKNRFYAESYTFFYLEDGGINSTGYAITDPQELAELQEFHKQVIQYRPVQDDGTQCDVAIHYTLKDGRTVKRYYEVGRNSPLGERAGKYFSDMRYLFEVQNTDILYGAFESVTLNLYTDISSVDLKLTTKEEIGGLLDAIKADCQAGTMAQNWAYHEDDSEKFDTDIKYQNSYHVEFSAKDDFQDYFGWNTSFRHLQIYPDCENTLAYIEAMLEKYPQDSGDAVIKTQ